MDELIKLTSVKPWAILTHEWYYIKNGGEGGKTAKKQWKSLTEWAFIIFSAFVWYPFKHFLSLITIWLPNSLFFPLEVF